MRYHFSLRSPYIILSRKFFWKPKSRILIGITSMAYDPVWQRLPDALAQVVTATGQTNEEAKIDICRAIADGAIKLRAKLDRHTTKGFRTSDTALVGGDFQLPSQLGPSDFDWEQSRPIGAWFLRRERSRVPGYWDLSWIELSRADVQTVLCASTVDAAPATTLQSARPARARPAFERAKSIIEELYPEGVPSQAELPNFQLCHRVKRKLAELRLAALSDDSILRAAGRRK